MGQKQRDAIAEAIEEVMADDDEDSGLCCTIEATNAQGEPVSVQVMQGSLNITPYAHNDEPLARLQACGATEGLDADLEVLDWDAGVFATVGIDGLDDEAVTQLIDQIFVHLLGCDDANYQITASTEDLG
jgi:hypothetical protein